MILSAVALVAAGAAAGAGAAALSRSLGEADTDRAQPSRVPRGQAAAAVAGAAIGLAAALFAPGTAAAIGVALIAWHLLAIAVCDEGTFRVPHLLPVSGMALCIGLTGAAGGWQAVVYRGVSVVAVTAVLLACAAVAKRVRGAPAVGTGDYGVFAFAASVCGPVVMPNVLLAASFLALVYSLGPYARLGGLSPPRPRPAPYAACAAVGILLVLLASLVSSGRPCGALGHDVVLRHLNFQGI